MKWYHNFEEIEKEIQENIPSIIYKYRDWKNKYHKKVISKKELWFAHPYSLNDPFDVRPPLNFIIPNRNFETIKSKIKDAGKVIESHLTEEKLDEEIEKRLESLKKDPQNYFRKNRIEYNQDSSHFDTFGILSFCSSYDNQSMWAHYGNNHSGFTIGFNTIKLAKALKCTLGIVEYNDNPIDYNILGNNEEIIFKQLFRKSKKWQVEEEIRFVTIGIGLYRNRSQQYPLDSIEEIIFGINTSEKIQNKIINTFNKLTPIIYFYKLKPKTDSYGFDKIRLIISKKQK